MLDKATVTIAVQSDLLEQIDEAAAVESRTRAELIADAMRQYIAEKQKWSRAFACGDDISSKNPLSDAEIMQEIKAYRGGR